MAKDIGLTPIKLFLIAMYNSVNQLFVEADEQGIQDKLAALCRLAIACFRRFVPLQLIDLAVINRLHNRLQDFEAFDRSRGFSDNEES